MKKGDILIRGTVERVVNKVYTHHYTWYYPELPQQIFDSKDSNDPSGIWWEIKVDEND